MAAPSVECVGVYRSKGPISNFKIRVRLERRTVAGPIPTNISSSTAPGTSSQSPPPSISNDIELRELPRTAVAALDVVDSEERVVGWQEKLLSHREMRLYADENNCKTARHREYRQLIIDNDKQQKTQSRWLFTYIDEDDAPTTGNELLTDAASQVETIQALNADRLRQRRTSSGEVPKMFVAPSLFGRSCAASTAFVSNKPTRVQQRLWHSLATCERVFCVMAELESSEIVLCTVKVDEHRVVRVQPDFRREAYAVHVGANYLGKESYWVTIENASEQIDDNDRLKEKNIKNEVRSHRKTQLSTLIGQDFESIPWDATCRVHVFGEIVSAERFEYDDLYVNFFLDLSSSPSWILDDDNESHMYGSTQTSSTKFLGNLAVAYFGHPFVYRMRNLRDYATSKLEECNPLSSWRRPTIMFQVMSRDAWNRFRTEGYGSVRIPNASGCHTFRVGTWRPVARSLGGELRRFFIGGSPELEDFSAIGVPSTHQGSILSKYGMRTETTGTLTIKLQIVQQKQQHHAAVGSGHQKAGDLDGAQHIAGVNSSSSAALQTSVAAVLGAFHRARHRMMVARDNLNL